MREADIRKYAELMKELELTGLEITDDHNRVRLERSVYEPSKEVMYAVSANSKAEDKNAETETAHQDYISIKSSIVGVFYAAPAENAQPYVSIGDRVKKGQTLCIVEAMKLMNEIVAEEDGSILDVCVTNGQVVEYGTELFRIKR